MEALQEQRVELSCYTILPNFTQDMKEMEGPKEQHTNQDATQIPRLGDSPTKLSSVKERSFLFKPFYVFGPHVPVEAPKV